MTKTSRREHHQKLRKRNHTQRKTKYRSTLIML